MMTSLQGKFVTVDGPNGAGKSTLVQNLGKKLSKDYNVLITKEPTNSEIGKLVRSMENKFRGEILACLIVADRILHLEEEVIPALNNNRIVICDRYIPSTLALQQLDNVSESFLLNLNEGLLTPNISVLLTGSEKIIRSRLRAREKLTFFETNFSTQEEIDVFEKVFINLETGGHNVYRMDAENNPQALVDALYSKVLNI